MATPLIYLSPGGYSYQHFLLRHVLSVASGKPILTLAIGVSGVVVWDIHFVHHKDINSLQNRLNNPPTLLLLLLLLLIIPPHYTASIFIESAQPLFRFDELLLSDAQRKEQLPLLKSDLTRKVATITAKVDSNGFS